MPRRAAAIAIAAVAIGGDWRPRRCRAADYRATAEAPTVLYDAPSARAQPQFVFGRDVPVEVLVSVEGWTKVRDLGGTIGWIATKSLAERRMLQVRVPAPPRSAPAPTRRRRSSSAPSQNVLLELAEPATSAGTTAAPGWVKVRHRDGATGYVRIAQVFGL